MSAEQRAQLFEAITAVHGGEHHRVPQRPVDLQPLPELLGVGFIIGGVVYPLVLGYVKDATTLYTVGFIAAAASLLLLNVAAVLAARDVKATAVDSPQAYA